MKKETASFTRGFKFPAPISSKISMIAGLSHQADEVCCQFHWDLLAVCVVATPFGVALLQLSNRRLGMSILLIGQSHKILHELGWFTHCNRSWILLISTGARFCPSSAALEPCAGGHCIGGETLLSCTKNELICNKKV